MMTVKNKFDAFLDMVIRLLGCLVVFLIMALYTGTNSRTFASETDGVEGWFEVATTYDSGLAMRIGPNIESELICRLADKTDIYITCSKDGWGYTHYRDYSGWVSLEYVIETSGIDRSCECENSLSNEYCNNMTDESVASTEFFSDGRSVCVDGYILPMAAERYFTMQELSPLTLKGLCYARNEIYARHGRMFGTGELQEYFSSRTWYTGIYEPSAYNDETIVNQMNSYEIYNLQLICAAEKKRGEYSPS